MHFPIRSPVTTLLIYSFAQQDIGASGPRGHPNCGHCYIDSDGGGRGRSRRGAVLQPFLFNSFFLARKIPGLSKE